MNPSLTIRIMGTSAGILLAFDSRQRKKYTPTEIVSLPKFYLEFFKFKLIYRNPLLLELITFKPI